MKRSARTPMDTHSIRSNEIVKEVINELVSAVEKSVLTKPKKKKNRKKGHRSGKRHREKQERKKARSLDLHKPHSDRWHFNQGEDNEIYEETKRRLEPAGFQLIDFYDTPIWEKTEGKLIPMTEPLEGREIFGLEVSMETILPLIKEWFAWMKELPDNVIIYACPTSHNLLTAFFQFSTPMNTILSMNFAMWCYKGEDYHFALDGNNARSWYNAHLKKVLEHKPFDTEAKECPICCEKPEGDNHYGSMGYGGLMPCQTCGNCACEKCILKYAGDQCNLRIIERDGKVDFLYSQPDHTCPFCRGGFWNPSDKTSVPRSLLEHWRDTCKKVNGDYVEISQIEQNTEFIRENIVRMRRENS